ncbi:hypothetical protein NQ317_019795 [Molorchus minor]|uniref:Uncharacterized protein n=1 Tax=Molorchus minor TaxID=1323400 RepID=A0ABQ9JCN9_9CUCU|nr:hypothetical protein NQ317_019795 [Molorchus minor]
MKVHLHLSKFKIKLVNNFYTPSNHVTAYYHCQTLLYLSYHKRERDGNINKKKSAGRLMFTVAVVPASNFITRVPEPVKEVDLLNDRHRINYQTNCTSDTERFGYRFEVSVILKRSKMAFSMLRNGFIYCRNVSKMSVFVENSLRSANMDTVRITLATTTSFTLVSSNLSTLKYILVKVNYAQTTTVIEGPVTRKPLAAMCSNFDIGGFKAC